MPGYPITCPECEGEKGWSDIDGSWIECEVCHGDGYVDEDTLDDREEDDE